MTDVSNTIIAGQWTLRPINGKVQVAIHGFNVYWLTDQQARDLHQALQVWIERTAKEAE